MSGDILDETADGRQPEPQAQQPFVSSSLSRRLELVGTAGFLALGLGMAFASAFWAEQADDVKSPIEGHDRDRQVQRPPDLSGDQYHGAFVATPLALVQHNPHIVNGMHMPTSEMHRLEQELAGGKVRIAQITIWDSEVGDGDTVEVVGAGFSQSWTLAHRKKTFFVPVIPGATVRIRATKDGGGGGVTLGLATILGEVRLPHLVVGQAIEVPAL